MSQYQRKQLPLNAWQYNSQPKADWPKFITSYSADSAYGPQPIGVSVGNLLVPVKGHSSTLVITPTDWVVFEDGKPARYTNAQFEAAFEAVNADDAHLLQAIQDAGVVKTVEVATAEPAIVQAVVTDPVVAEETPAAARTGRGAKAAVSEDAAS